MLSPVTAKNAGDVFLRHSVEWTRLQGEPRHHSIGTEYQITTRQQLAYHNRHGLGLSVGQYLKYKYLNYYLKYYICT